MAEEECEARIDSARRQGFAAGRRAGLWLAFNGPRAKAQARRLDVQAMRRQDVALEGLGDVFGQAEEQARRRDILRRIPRPQVIQRPAPAPAPPAPAQRTRLTLGNARNYIGRTVFFTVHGQEHSATILRVSPSGIAIDGGPPSVRGALSFSRVLLV